MTTSQLDDLFEKNAKDLGLNHQEDGPRYLISTVLSGMVDRIRQDEQAELERSLNTEQVRVKLDIAL